MDVGGQWEGTISSTVYFAIADRFVKHVKGYWMAICTPANSEEEFVLTENGYNVHEGPTVSFEDKNTGECISLGSAFHYFAPIAPRVMMLLRNQHLPEPLDDGDPDTKELRKKHREVFIDSFYGSGTESIMEDLPVHKAFNSYSKVMDGRRTPLPEWDGKYRKNDCFTFPIFQISTEYTHKMNGLLLDNAFHGLTVIFNRQDVFLDLVEWYLTEPCEIGKNLIGENREIKRRYIEQLTILMAAQGREVSTKVIDWPTRKDLDIARFREVGIASVRWAQELAKDRSKEPEEAGTKTEQQPVNETDPGPEEIPEDESETSREDAEEPEQLPDEIANAYSHLRLQCYLQEDALLRLTYEIITKRVAASQSHTDVPRDVSTPELEHSLAMLHIWLVCTQLDRQENVERDDRLENLLQSFQAQEPTYVFWHFLKRIRHALKVKEYPSLVVDEKELEGPEDAIQDGKL